MSKSIFQRISKVGCSVLILFLFASCILTYQVFAHDCLWWECAPKRNFTVYDLNLPRKYFPLDADIHDLHFLRGDNVSVEVASTTNYWKNGSAIYIVRRFATINKAIKNYEYDSQLSFMEQPTSNEYDDIVLYSSKLADDNVVRCGYVQGDPRCVYVARYEEYTIFFSASMGDEEMTGSNFLGVLEFIDEKITRLLDNGN
jgi:hypothetical protein